MFLLHRYLCKLYAGKQFYFEVLELGKVKSNVLFFCCNLQGELGSKGYASAGQDTCST